MIPDSTLKTSTKGSGKINNPMRRPKLAFVLSSGGIRGMAHVGALEVMEEAGIVPDLIVGCSAGAIVGMLYADKQGIAHIKKTALEMAPYLGSYRLLPLPSIYKGFVKKQGYFSMQKAHKYLSGAVQATTFEELKIPLAVVATNLNKGRSVVFSQGPLVQAVCASAAAPGLFQPVCIQEEYYVDGFVLDPFPVLVAKKLQAELTIGINICNNIEEIKKGEKIVNINLRSLTIANRQRIQEAIDQADIVVDPEFKNTGWLFTSTKGALRLYEAGKRAAKKMLPKIKASIDKLGPTC